LGSAIHQSQQWVSIKIFMTQKSPKAQAAGVHQNPRESAPTFYPVPESDLSCLEPKEQGVPPVFQTSKSQPPLQPINVPRGVSTHLLPTPYLKTSN